MLGERPLPDRHEDAREVERCLAKALLQGLELLPEDLGDAGQDVDVPDGDGGKHQRTVGHELGALRNLGEAESRLVHRPLVVAFEQSDETRVADDARAHRPRHAFHGDVVVGRPDAAGGEDHVQSLAELAHLGGDEVDLVGNDGDLADLHPERAQLPAEEGGVGVGDLARRESRCR